MSCRMGTVGPVEGRWSGAKGVGCVTVVARKGSAPVSVASGHAGWLGLQPLHGLQHAMVADTTGSTARAGTLDGGLMMPSNRSVVADAIGNTVLAGVWMQIFGALQTPFSWKGLPEGGPVRGLGCRGS